MAPIPGKIPQKKPTTIDLTTAILLIHNSKIVGKSKLSSGATYFPIAFFSACTKISDTAKKPKIAGTNAIPGGPIRDDDGNPIGYDIKAQTRAVVENIARILEEAGSSMDKIVDVTSFLVDMDRDFAGYNEVWAETLGHYGPTRTTLAIRALPTPIAVEMKVIAKI